MGRHAAAHGQPSPPEESGGGAHLDLAHQPSLTRLGALFRQRRLARNFMTADAAVPSTAAARRARHYFSPRLLGAFPGAVLLLLMRAKLLLARAIPANVASSG